MISKEMKLTADALRMRFAELYTQITIDGKTCFKLEDVRIISLGCLASCGAFVVEYADNAEEAALNRFEDGDLFYIDEMGVDELFSAMRQEIDL